MGWGIAVASIMINTVAVCGYLSRCAPVATSLNLTMFQMHIAPTASPRTRFEVYCCVYNSMLIALYQGEMSALSSLARALGGFSVAYFQVPWASKYGALQTFGVEAACAISSYFCSQLFTDDSAQNSIVVGLFLLIIPTLQLKGRYLRVCDMLNSCLHALTG
jgi:hypothetical protein